ncbi:MAG: B12-binding domain-containing radical SAM protein [Hahellaceae bacterium]|nr:B12-binding domain-containing radical SAM protein [Hahellaceae bacterium]
MRVLFFHPEKYLNFGIPAGISILSAVIKQHGHEVDLFDTTFLKCADDHKLDGHDAAQNVTAGDDLVLENIDEFDESEEEVLGKQCRGLFKETAYSIHDLVKDDPVVVPEVEFQKKIDEFKPDIIALSTMTTTFDHAVGLLRKVKHNAKVIVGGVHPTIATGDCLEQEVIDIACVGEADETFPELLNLMEAGQDYTGVKSMHFRLEDGTIIHNEVAPRVELNNLPTPDWGIFDSRHLFRPFDGEIYKGSFYSQSRGCPMQCTYCVDPTIAEITGGHKGYFRFQDPEVSYRQLKELKDKFGATWFKFVDDTFLLPNMDHLTRLRDLIKPLGIKFGCSVMPNTIKEEKLQIAVDMGCVAMSVGIESGNDAIRRTVMRRYKNDEVVEKLQLAQKYGIRVSTFNIIGFPGESRENVFETIELNRRIGTSAANAYILYPYPGTPIAIEHKIPLRDKTGLIPTVDIGPKLGFSEMSEQELLGLRSAFNLYLVLPKSLYPVIEFAEAQNDLGGRLLKLLNHLAVATVTGNPMPTDSLRNMLEGKGVRIHSEGNMQLPKLFKYIFRLPFETEQLNTIVAALVETYGEKKRYEKVDKIAV